MLADTILSTMQTLISEGEVCRFKACSPYEKYMCFQTEMDILSYIWMDKKTMRTCDYLFTSKKNKIPFSNENGYVVV